jgi:hypothetical protein
MRQTLPMTRRIKRSVNKPSAFHDLPPLGWRPEKHLGSCPARGGTLACSGGTRAWRRQARAVQRSSLHLCACMRTETCESANRKHALYSLSTAIRVHVKWKTTISLQFRVKNLSTALFFRLGAQSAHCGLRPDDHVVVQFINANLCRRLPTACTVKLAVTPRCCRAAAPRPAAPPR